MEKCESEQDERSSLIDNTLNGALNVTINDPVKNPVNLNESHLKVIIMVKIVLKFIHLLFLDIEYNGNESIVFTFTIMHDFRTFVFDLKMNRFYKCLLWLQNTQIPSHIIQEKTNKMWSSIIWIHVSSTKMMTINNKG